MFNNTKEKLEWAISCVFYIYHQDEYLAPPYYSSYNRSISPEVKSGRNVITILAI